MGRPTVSPEVRTLIRTMSQANPRWGAPRIHGELLKLGLDICETTVAKYMERPSQPSIEDQTVCLHSPHLASAVSSFSISSITRFIDRTVRSSGSSVVMSTPASFSKSIGYFDPPALRNAR
jgi:hypothetical protein